jgi:hypothetical protein
MLTHNATHRSLLPATQKGEVGQALMAGSDHVSTANNVGDDLETEVVKIAAILLCLRYTGVGSRAD